jgi:predicted ATPase
VPLFVEELTKMVLESGLLQERDGRYELTGPLPPLAIPTTLHDSLMARLDRLATVKALAQLGATLGREFSYEWLQAVAPWDEDALQQGLHQLVAAEFLYQQGVPPQATYRFKHALIQDAAYQSLLRSTRQQYHQRIAQVLEARFPKICASQPELLAHHYTEAGAVAQAVSYWQQAGQRAVARSAHVEAISHLTRGLDLLTTLPDTPERRQQELVLLTTLGPAFTATKGIGSPETGHVYARAHELCQQVGETPQLFPTLAGLARFYLNRGEMLTARALGEQLLRLAHRTHDLALVMEAHRTLGSSLFWGGELPLAQAHLEEGLALYHPQQHGGHALLYGRDPGMEFRGFASLTLWFLGYPDQAIASLQEALHLVHELTHPYSLATAFNMTAWLHQCRRERPLTQERAEAVLALATEHGLAQRWASSTVLLGWTLAEQGRVEEGMVQIRQGLAAWQATGSRIWRPYFLALLADVCAQGGQGEEGLTVLAEALAAVDHTGERLYEAELYRLKGKLLLALPADDQAEAMTCFQHALTVARRQQAKSLELRAAVSLARLWQQQGKGTEAYDLLAPIYGWFTEGFDTADLQEASALLEALS